MSPGLAISKQQCQIKSLSLLIENFMYKKLIPLFILLIHFHVYAQSLNESWIDQTVNPGENFFMFANGHWMKKHPIPSSEAEWSIFDILQKNVSLQIKKMLNDLPKNTQMYQNKINQQLYLYYTSGLDSKTIEYQQFKPLLPYIKDILNIHDIASLTQVIAKFHQIDISGLFSFGSFNDLHHKNQIIGEINQPTFILPNRSYYLSRDPRTLKIQKAYQKFITSLFLNIGYNKEQAHQAYLDCWTIESKLAAISANNEYFRNPKHIDNPVSRQTLIQNYPNLNLGQYFKDLNIQTSQSMNLTNPHYFLKLNAYLPTLSFTSIQHYLTGLLLSEFSNKLSQNFQQPFCEFSKTIRGFNNCPPAWQQVLNSENYYLGFAIGDLYVASYGNLDTINYVKNMVSSIRESLAHHLKSSTWLTPQTKIKALDKLQKMDARIGYPQPLNYEDLHIHSKIYVENVIEARRFEISRNWRQIGKAKNKSEWDMPPQSINAYYSVAQNQINIPLGILQPPFFSLKGSGASNFGGIGVVIGHEIFHGFDDEGSQFDANGIYKRWWTKAEWERYNHKINCIKSQYSRYTIPNTHLKVNGKLVSGEAIADLGGVTLALYAYIHSKFLEKDINQKGYTPIQQFFIQFGQIWTSNIKPEEAHRKGLIDPHPPKKWRVNGTLSNVPEFYQAFHLPKPKKQCELF